MSDCLIWPGAKNSAGYPITWHEGHWAYAHRVVAGAKKGEVVMHSCDNPSCVNPKHLYIGTPKQNSEDMVAKNRQAKGEQCGNSKLTAEQVIRIRAMACLLSRQALATKFGTSKANVNDIVNRKTWRHI